MHIRRTQDERIGKTVVIILGGHRALTDVSSAAHGMICRTPVSNWELARRWASVITHPQSTLLVNPLANSLYKYMYGSTHSQITLNIDPPTKSARDLTFKAQVLPHKTGH